jgi:hypothetical protein
MVDMYSNHVAFVWYERNRREIKKRKIEEKLEISLVWQGEKLR